MDYFICNLGPGDENGFDFAEGDSFVFVQGPAPSDWAER